MHLREKSCEKYQVVRYVTGMCIDMDEILCEFRSRKSFTIEFFWNLLVMLSGCPCNQEIYFLKIRVAQNLVAQRIPGKCWINITEITMASSGSRPCIQ